MSVQEVTQLYDQLIEKLQQYQDLADKCKEKEMLIIARVYNSSKAYICYDTQNKISKVSLIEPNEPHDVIDLKSESKRQYIIDLFKFLDEDFKKLHQLENEIKIIQKKIEALKEVYRWKKLSLLTSMVQ